MSDLIVRIWRQFLGLLGEEHWEFPLNADRKEVLDSLERRVTGVPRWRALSPVWNRPRAQFYGHIASHRVVVRVFPTKSDSRALVSTVAAYAFVGRIVERPGGPALVGNYQVVLVLRQFGILYFGFSLFFIFISTLGLAHSILIAQNLELSFRAGAILLGGCCFVAFIRLLIWLPEHWDRPQRANLHQFLSNLAAGRTE